MKLRLIIFSILFLHYQGTLSDSVAIGVDLPMPARKSALHAKPKAPLSKPKLSDQIRMAAQSLAIQKVRNKNRLPIDLGKSEILQEQFDLEFGDDGYPSEAALQRFVRAKLLHAPSMSDIVIKSVSGGYWTDKVYAVSLKNLKRPVFFLKISRKQESANSIIELQKSLIGRLGINSRYSDSKLLIPRNKLPIICWIEAIFSYTNAFNQPSRLEVIHAAHGVSIYSLIENGTIEEIVACGRAFGSSLGFFQQAFMNYVDENDAFTWTTVAHSDLHGYNCFFDVSTNRIYWIDIDTMEQGLPMYYDMHLLREGLSSNDVRSVKFSYAATSSYVQSFSPQRQPVVASMLKTFMSLREYERLGFPYNLTDYSPLIVAIITGNESEIENLLKSGASLDEHDTLGHSPFEWAVLRNNVQAAKLLMNYGFDINQPNDKGLSMLSLAIEKQADEEVEFLIALGADINLADASWHPAFMRYLETPLHRAVDTRNLKSTVALLKAKNINVNALSKGKQTALFRLTSGLRRDGSYAENDIRLAQILIDAGINTAVKDTKGQTAFDLVPEEMKETFGFLKPKVIDPLAVERTVDLARSVARQHVRKIVKH